ncbi:hypothetical protein QWZ14_31255 [Paeniroseomonas aquatica]|uniref:Uncharacterized protein n=1 Tax=Paeniroseomonas aquatica TaxID=373043 RepID=A0ABT8AGQ7_9PROT|nr:hypothetical protein [Paeniroseomonas aquatica]MDN3568878.1 hypothetical protein [Paeniroseomonas aquatica]
MIRPRPAPRPRPLLRRLARLPLVPLAILVVLLEATVWRWLTALGRVLSRLAVFAALERLVARLSPRMVVAAFVLPFLAFIPLLKFGELWLFLHGHLVLGVLLLVAAKVVGVAFSARLFEIARPKMLQVPRFAWAYGHGLRAWAWCHALLEGIPAWVAARGAVQRGLARGRAALAGAWHRLRAGVGRPAAGGVRARLAAAIRQQRR